MSFQLRPRQPQAYSMFSNAALLAEATGKLESALGQLSATDLDEQLKHIHHLITLPPSLPELPFVKAGLAIQEKLINALIAVLHPERVTIFPSSDTRRDAGLRERALETLIAIEDIRSDSNYSTMSAVGPLSRALPSIFLSPRMDMPTLSAYHEKLIGWPCYMSEYRRDYYGILDRLETVSNSPRGDETTMLWIRNTAKGKLAFMEFCATGTLAPRAG